MKETDLLLMIQRGELFMDLTVKDMPSPLTFNEVLFREDISHIRAAVPGDIPHINEFLESIKLIEEATAK